MYSEKYNKTLKISTLLFFIAAFSTGLSAQTMEGQEVGNNTRTLSVSELFQLGIENSLHIQASLLQEEIAGDQQKTAQSLRLPDINAGFSGGYIGQPTVFSHGLSGARHPETPDWMQNYNVEVIQPLFQGGKIKYNIEKTALEQQIARLNTDRDKAEIKLLLIAGYLDLFKLYKQQEVLQLNIEESKHRLHDIRQLRKQGMITQNDVIRSELQLTNYELALRETGNNIRITSQQLDIALGLDENLLLRPDTAIFHHLHPVVSCEEYIQQAYDNYPELKIIKSDILVARKEKQLWQADNLPSLSLHAGNTLARPIASTSPMQDLFMNSWNASLTLSYRLSSLYHNRHNVNASERMVTLRQNQEELQKQEIRNNIRSSFIKHQEATDRIKAFSTYVLQANENYRIVQNKYLNQLAILTDLLDAGSVRLDAELQLIAARANELYTWYQLLRASGEL